MNADESDKESDKKTKSILDDHSRSGSPEIIDEATHQVTHEVTHEVAKKRNSLVKQQTINKTEDDKISLNASTSPLETTKEEAKIENHDEVNNNNRKEVSDEDEQNHRRRSSGNKDHKKRSDHLKTEGMSRKNKHSRPSMIALPENLYVDGLTSRAASTAVTPLEAKSVAKQVYLKSLPKAKGRRCIQTIKVSIWVTSVFTVVFSFFYFFLHVLLLVKVWDPVHSEVLDPGTSYTGTSLMESDIKHEDHRHSKEKSVLSLILILALSFHSTLFYLFSSKLAKSIRIIDNFHRFASPFERHSVGNIFKVYNNDVEPFSPNGSAYRQSSGCALGCSPISCRASKHHRGGHYDRDGNFFNYDDRHETRHETRKRRQSNQRHPQYLIKKSRARSRIDKEMGISSRDRKYLMLSFFGLLIAILCLLIHTMLQLIFCLAVYSPFMDVMDCLLLLLSCFIIVFSVSFIFTASYYHRQTIYN